MNFPLLPSLSNNFNFSRAAIGTIQYAQYTLFDNVNLQTSYVQCGMTPVAGEVETVLWREGRDPMRSKVEVVARGARTKFGVAQGVMQQQV